jgi:hypothetical protein
MAEVFRKLLRFHFLESGFDREKTGKGQVKDRWLNRWVTIEVCEQGEDG